MTFVEHVREWAEGNGYTVRRYSGRGMFGKTCLGVVVPNVLDISDLYFHLGWEHVDGPLPKLCYDNLGLDIIAYWPGVPE